MYAKLNHLNLPQQAQYGGAEHTYDDDPGPYNALAGDAMHADDKSEMLHQIAEHSLQQKHDQSVRIHTALPRFHAQIVR